MEVEDLQGKVKKAKEAVEFLEEPLKTEAFKKILDKLLETPNQSSQVTQEEIYQKKPLGKKEKVKKRHLGNGEVGKAGLKLKEESEAKKRELAEKVNRTQHPEIFKLKSILPMALCVLKIMKGKNVKHLTPPEIQFILRESFGIKKSAESISVALNRIEAKTYTYRSRIVIGRTVAYKYEIMTEGEKYLERKIKNDNHEDKTDDGEEPDLA